jgi:uncharacterized protein YndB with AHSA1/START domain
MILRVALDQRFEQPIDQVWRALIDPVVLAEWLLENDFEPRVGKRFTLRCPPIPGWNGRIEAVVLELDPPRRMVWSWSDGFEVGEPTRVTFELRREGSGTRLTLRHEGAIDDTHGARLGLGWPEKLEQLLRALGQNPRPAGPP